MFDPERKLTSVWAWVAVLVAVAAAATAAASARLRCNEISISTFANSIYQPQIIGETYRLLIFPELHRDILFSGVA